MDIIESGYRYRVYDLKKKNPQDITFTRRKSDGTFDPGTTNEELIDVLIARMHALNAERPSPENKCVIILLKSIRQLLSGIVTKKKNNVNETDKKKRINRSERESETSVHEDH